MPCPCPDDVPDETGPDEPADRSWLLTNPNGFPIPAALLELLICDSVIDRLTTTRTGRILALHSHGRIATPQQATAVASRDGGCIFPGCWAPPRSATSTTSAGGPGRTAIDNLALLCWRHHELIHAPVKHPHDAWDIVMLDGIPHIIRPRAHDPDRKPLRNTLRDAINTARTFGNQLRHDERGP